MKISNYFCGIGIVLILLVMFFTSCNKTESEEVSKIEIQFDENQNAEIQGKSRPEIQINIGLEQENEMISDTSEEVSVENSEKDEENTVSEVNKAVDSTKSSNKSILDFLKIATKPVGSTMYIWGGGWNEEDTAAGIEAVTLGVSARWGEFASRQDSSYDYNFTKYQIHDGLDCSGYVGWAVYNVLETENGKEGYVLASTQMAKNYANRGLGEYIPVRSIAYWQAGDIMSMDGHVWIVVGMCDDGSVLFLHASPPGVFFCGTNLANGSSSQAVALAERIMSGYYPEWYAKYPECSRSYSYLTSSSAMRWSRDVLNDEEELTEMSAEEVVEVIFR